MLSLILPHLSEYLTYIINTCLSQNVFPSMWKRAHVIPIPKNNNPTDYCHFRPISILPTISKILEKIVANQLKLFLTKKQILPAIQSGFRANHSTTTALLNVTDDIYRATDQNMSTILVLLDFSKAFDTLNHLILCKKLRHFGLSHYAVLFIENYLSNRCQRVTVNGNLSNLKYSSRGVPQGSVLGPLLFSIYTADFNRNLTNCNIHQYADDTQIYFSFFPHDFNNAVNTINLDLEQISIVSKAHGLILNETKTEVLLFGKNRKDLAKNSTFKILINNQILEFNDHCKNLGILLDVDLRFNKHSSNLIQKSYYKLKALYMHKDILTPELKLKLCDTLILSSLSYCDTVYWPALLKKDQESLQNIQNSCLRFSLNIRKFDHISHRFHETNWLNLNERYQLHMACLVYNLNKNGEPLYLFEKMVRGIDTQIRKVKQQECD